MTVGSAGIDTSPNKPKVNRRAQLAMVGAAYGDALGWPNESLGRVSLKKPRVPPSSKLVGWQRRDGWRGTSHAEAIHAGCYSDDTQLIISVSRSRSTNDWWQHLTRVELPFWRLYQRGGGGATLRAAKSWSDGKTPWKALQEQYFEAGGNGAAMRILPHAIWHTGSANFETLHDDVALDSLATHGHPRAVIGASLFAYLLWTVLRRTETLHFGELIEIAINNSDSWTRPLHDSSSLLGKLKSVDWIAPRHYGEQWSSVSKETLDLLYIARKAMDAGALFIDRPVLQDLGAIGPSRGSGVICSAAAAFLASRYASDPIQGVIEAAYCAGADTDTLASMTASLLACLSEGEQIAHAARQVQDYDFLISVPQTLLSGTRPSNEVARRHAVTSTTASRWSKALWDRSEAEAVQLLNGVEGRIKERTSRRERDLTVLELSVLSSDGQTFRFKRVNKGLISKPDQPLFEERASALPAIHNSGSLGSASSYTFAPEFVLRTNHLDATLQFYETLLGLRVFEDRRPRTDQVRLEGPLTFVQARDRNEVLAGLELRLRTRNLVQLSERLREAGQAVTSDLSETGVHSLSVKDPDGRSVIIIGVRQENKA